MKKSHLHISIITLFAFFLFGTGVAYAESYSWLDHEAPFDFLFLNHLDTHQQTKLLNNGELQGFFYIEYTGNYIEGFPEAVHGQETVGWILHGIPMSAKLLAKSEDQHPLWCISPADLPSQRGYTHFHWLDEAEHGSGLTEGETYDGYLLKLTARDNFFFEHHGGFFVTPGIDYYTHDNIVTNCE